MLHKLLLAALSITFSTLSPVVLAARSVEQFEVSVTIPTLEFYVLPVDPRVMEQDQRLDWNLATLKLSTLRADFYVKNTNGGISARLTERAYLQGEFGEIDLNVKFNNIQLSLNTQPVVNDARAGRRVPLEIAAVEPPKGYKAGDYYGTVHILFEAVSP
jgi:hypothetical protein